MKKFIILIAFVISTCDQAGQNKLLLGFRDYDTKVGFVPNIVTIYELDTHHIVYQYRPNVGQMNLNISLPNGRYRVEINGEPTKDEPHYIQASQSRYLLEGGRGNNGDIFARHRFMRADFKVLDNKWDILEDHKSAINGSVVSLWKEHEKVIRLEPKSSDSLVGYVSDSENQDMKEGYSLQTGYVSDEDTGMMLEGVKVEFQVNEDKVVGYTNDRGFYKMYFPISSSGYWLESYEKEGYGKKTFKHDFLGDEGVSFSSHTLIKGGKDLYEDDTVDADVDMAANTNTPTPQHALMSPYSPSFPDLSDEEKTHPLLVKVGFSELGGACGGAIPCTQVREFHVYDEYLPVVLASEIYAAFWVDIDNKSYNSFKSAPQNFVPEGYTFGTESMNMMKALAVAAYSYMQWHKKYSNFYTPSGEKYDICSNTACQAFTLNRYCQFNLLHRVKLAEVVKAVTGYVLTYNDQVARAEYSAEPNNLSCYDSPHVGKKEHCPCSGASVDKDGTGSADGYVGMNTMQYPCVFDPASVGHSQRGHHRGLSQYGALRWSTGRNIEQKDTKLLFENRLVLFDNFQRKHWVEILALYYNAPGWKLVRDKNLAFMEDNIGGI